MLTSFETSNHQTSAETLTLIVQFYNVSYLMSRRQVGLSEASLQFRGGPGGVGTAQLGEGGMKVRKVSIAAVVLVYEMFADWIIGNDHMYTYVQ